MQDLLQVILYKKLNNFIRNPCGTRFKMLTPLHVRLKVPMKDLDLPDISFLLDLA